MDHTKRKEQRDALKLLRKYVEIRRDADIELYDKNLRGADLSKADYEKGIRKTSAHAYKVGAKAFKKMHGLINEKIEELWTHRQYDKMYEHMAGYMQQCCKYLDSIPFLIFQKGNRCKTYEDEPYMVTEIFYFACALARFVGSLEWGLLYTETEHIDGNNFYKVKRWARTAVYSWQLFPSLNELQGHVDKELKDFFYNKLRSQKRLCHEHIKKELQVLKESSRLQGPGYEKHRNLLDHLIGEIS